ncbi:MAG: hypothetical protein JWN64_277 [Parcubacteria group bacterium]|nr:hypothetical protein [Parcubacteria group bacterium]
MLALFDRKSINTRDVEFKLGGPGKISALVVIDAVEAQNASGDYWSYKGHVRRMLPHQKDGVPPPPLKVEGSYHTTDRQGSMRTVD